MDRLDEHAAAGLSGPASAKPVKHVQLLQRGTEPAVEERLLRSRPLTASTSGGNARMSVQAAQLIQGDCTMQIRDNVT